MRVLQLNLSYRGTGADRCARELYEELPRLGVRCSMWVSERRGDDPPAIQGVKEPLERWLAPLEAFPDVTDWRHRGCFSKLRGLSSAEFDVVHIHNIHSGSFSIRAVRELTERLPCVWTLHDEWAPNLGLTYNLTGKVTPRRVKELSRGVIKHLPYDRYHENYKWRRTRRFLRKWLPQPRVVICPSRYMADLTTAAGTFPNSEIVTIHNGTGMCGTPEAAMPRGEARLSFGLDPDRPVVLMISADLAQAHKGIDLGIMAIRALAPPLQPQVMVLGPSGPSIARNLAPLQVVCATLHDDASLARAYRAADITVIPSLGENFPYVGIESLACGTPIVAFPIGGMREITGDHERGIVGESLDPLEMSKHIGFLLQNSEKREAMGIRGTDWVRETCGMPGYLRSVTDIYKRAIKSQ